MQVRRFAGRQMCAWHTTSDGCMAVVPAQTRTEATYLPIIPRNGRPGGGVLFQLEAKVCLWPRDGCCHWASRLLPEREPCLPIGDSKRTNSLPCGIQRRAGA